MKRIILAVMIVTIALFGCKRKEHVQVVAPPAAVAPAPVAAPAAPVAETGKPAPTPGTFAAKTPSTPKEEKPSSFAKKVAKPKDTSAATADSAAPSAAPQKKGFGAKKPK